MVKRRRTEKQTAERQRGAKRLHGLRAKEDDRCGAEKERSGAQADGKETGSERRIQTLRQCAVGGAGPQGDGGTAERWAWVAGGGAVGVD